MQNRWLAIGALLALAPACAEMDRTAEVEQVAEAQDPLLTNAENVSDYSGNSYFESETSGAVASDGTEYVGYNRFDPNNMSAWSETYNGVTGEGRRACEGTSRTGYAIRSSSGVWNRYSVATASGISMLWGDPSVATLGNTVFLTGLSSPSDLFNSKWNETYGGKHCIRFSTVDPTYPSGIGATGAIAGACIARGTSPGQLSLNPSRDCVRLGNDFFDGGNLTATSTYVYAAYWDTNTGLPAIYRATATGTFTKIANPPSITSINGHPLLSAAGSSVYFAAPTSSGVKVTVFEEASGTWSGAVGTIPINPVRTFSLSDGTAMRSRGYDFKHIPAVWAPGGLIFAAHISSGGKTVVAAYTCSTVGYPPISCNTTPIYTSEAGANAFYPSIGVVNVQDNYPAASGIPDYSLQTVISHWSESGSTGGQVRMRYYDMSSKVAYWAPNQYHHPCADSVGYWADYDTMHIRSSHTTRPKLIRTATDSTDGCRSTTVFNPHQHVSAIVNGYSPLLAVGSSRTTTTNAGQERRFMIPVAAGKSYRVSVAPTSGDADLYTKNSTIDFGRYGSGLASADCIAAAGGTTVDTCTITASSDGTAYILVYGWTTATYAISVTQL